MGIKKTISTTVSRLTLAELRSFANATAEFPGDTPVHVTADGNQLDPFVKLEVSTS